MAEQTSDGLQTDTQENGHELRLVLRNVGLVDPESIDSYIARGGYRALARVLESMSREQVVDWISRSGLRGRGGAGFPVGRKWSLAAAAEGERKFLICNGDEGDPGAFMDRSILEWDPHSVLEGMAIAAYAIGATQGYVYVRAEYPVAVERVRMAIAQARERGFLGDNVLGSDLCFDIDLRIGAGAFVCGEETALIASIGGQRGEPRPRPPFPAQRGLEDMPTVVNNVETLANIPWIIENEPESFAAIGTPKSKGTKTFSVAGKVNKPGLIEVPMGVTLREIVYDIAGGIPGKRQFKAVQTGGPLGGCLPADYLDTPIDYESLTSAGSMMGSGGLVVMDSTDCMVDVARFFMEFTQEESCGRCVPCRLGTREMLDILTRICNGEGEPEDLDRLESLAGAISSSALCALGQGAPNPVVSTLRHFRHEYEAHVYDKCCPARACTALVRFEVSEARCKRCGRCFRVCPSGAVRWTKGEVATIDRNLCARCGRCVEVCAFDAIC